MNETPDQNAGQQANPTPAGWYPDGSGGQRWWDGTQWTEHVHPAEGAPAAAVPADHAAAAASAAHATPTDPAAPTEPKKRRTGLIIALSVVGALVVLGGLGAATVGALSAVLQRTAPTPTALPPLEPTDPFEFDDEDKSDEDNYETPGGLDYEAMFKERDEFMRNQQLPLDGSMLKAVTQAQIDFVEQMRQEFAANGSEFTEVDESIVLALASDACETAILNGHKIDKWTLRSHAATSPLIAALQEQADPSERAEVTEGAMQIAATGVSYMCPADSAQFTSGLSTINGAW